MARVPHNKRAGKLNRGEFLVIRVGTQFFAGYDLIVTKQDVTKPRAQLNPEPKTRIPGYDYWWNRAILRFKKPRFKSKPESKVVEQKRELKLVSSVDDALKYRRVNQAEAACEMLNRHYRGIAKATVEYHGE